jgi:hypothetical protein
MKIWGFRDGENKDDGLAGYAASLVGIQTHHGL